MKSRPFSIVSLLVLFFLISILDVSAREPTDAEQYFLEFVNQARANPEAEVVRLQGDSGWYGTPDLNEGLSPGTISSDPKQPLAFDTLLLDSSDTWCRYLLENELFEHSDIRDQMQNAGYPIPDYGMLPLHNFSENLALANSRQADPPGEQDAEHGHNGLFTDNLGPMGRGHRLSLMNPEFREIGITMLADVDNETYYGGGSSNDVAATQHFAYIDGRIFVTGVIFNDLNENDFYNIGESAGKLPLSVKTPGGQVVATGESFDSGGYSIDMDGLAPGTYALCAVDGSGKLTTKNFSWTGNENVKVDLIDPVFVAPILPPVSTSTESSNSVLATALLSKSKKLLKKAKAAKKSGQAAKAKRLKKKAAKLRKKANQL